MASSQTIPWESLAKWSGAAFILAGVARLANQVLFQAGQHLSSFTAPESALDVTLFVAFELAFLGLLGLYPRLTDQRPRVAKAGAVLVVVSGVSLLVMAPAEYVLGGEQPPAYLMPFQIAYFLGIPLSFLTIGGVSFRTGTPSARIGGLLALGGLTWFGILTGNETVILAATTVFVLVLLSVGYLIHADAAVNARAEPATEPAVR